MNRSKRARKHETFKNLPNNLRFYVLASAICISLLTACWLRLHIPSDQLFFIRTQQLFGFIALIYWYIALITSPLSRVFGKKGRMQYLLFARRAIGVSAAYFALLHTAVAFWGQIGGWQGLGFLPDRFKWSFAFGLVGLIVLGFMTVTSFDKVVKYMTFRHWKRLHRVGYVAGVLVLLHVWMIATHIAYPWVKFTLAAMLIILAGLEAFRIAENLAKKHKAIKHKQKLLMLVIWAVCSALILGTPRFVKNYHQERHSTNHGTEHK